MGKYYFYMATALSNDINADVILIDDRGTVYGYMNEPNLTEVDNNDLRFISYCTIDQISKATAGRR